MKDNNDKLVEDDIVKATCFSGGIYGTTAVIVNATSLFGKRALKKKNQNHNWSM